MSVDEPTLKDVWQAQMETRQELRQLSQAQLETHQEVRQLSQAQLNMRQEQQQLSQAQQDMWRLLGSMNRRVGERFDVLERQVVAVDTRVAALEARVATGEARVTAAIGALKDSIEARDFRLDDHGRRLTVLEDNLP